MGDLNTRVKKIRELILGVRKEFLERLANPNRYAEDSPSVRRHHVMFDEIASRALEDANAELLNFLGAVDD